MPLLAHELARMDHVGIAIALLGALGLVVGVARVARKEPDLFLQQFGTDKSQSLEGIVRSRWSQMPSAKYLLQLPFRKVYVLPSSSVNEYAWKPDAEISSNGDLQERLLGRWSFIGSQTPDEVDGPYHRAVQYTKTDLTKHMTRYLPKMQDEIASFLHEEIQSSKDWNAVKIHDFCIALCFRVYQKAFVGDELYMDPSWKSACVGHGTSAVGVAASLTDWPSWLRPLVAQFLAAPQDVKRHVTDMEDMVRPVLKARLNDTNTDGYEKPADFIQWWIDRGGPSKEDPHALVMALLQLNFAGIRSTGVVVMQTLIDLCQHGDHTSAMLAEVKKVLEQANETRPSTASLAKMPLIDSFVKESQRHVPQNVLSVYRKAVTPLQLSDGSILPSSSYVCVPSIDPDAQKNTTRRPFDGFRWARLREETPGQETKYLSVATGPQSLEFGAGAHACPGRFIAMAVAKSVLTEILLGYSLRLPPGDEVKSLQYNRVLVLAPDREQQLEFRKETA